MDHQPLVLILMGPPGVGKGTQATKLSKALKIPHISTGEIFRDNIKRQTPLGKQTQSIIEQGGFVSDDIVNAIVFDRVVAEDCKQGYILDGYPRTEYQAISLEKFFQDNVRLIVINYFVEDQVILERLTGRLTCSYCSQPFHQLFNPPQQKGVCDRCAHPLIQRKDDEESTVKERLSIYKQQTEPLIRLYEKKHLLTTIHCIGSIDEILSQTLSLLNVKHK
jgi:adenylate kinase